MQLILKQTIANVVLSALGEAKLIDSQFAYWIIVPDEGNAYRIDKLRKSNCTI